MIANGELLDDLILESYIYPAGPAGTTPSHAHEGYQISFGDGPACRYRYRGGWHVVPPHTLSVLMPGEVHLAVELEDRPEESSYQVLYVDPRRVADFAAELGGRPSGTPTFDDVVLADRDLITNFQHLHLPSTRLGLDSGVRSLLAGLIARHTDHPVDPPPVAGPRHAVRIVREYLEENFAANVSLEKLAGVVNLSPFHLARLFRQEVGMPPHAYQLQLRVTRAKRLLLEGVPVSDVATETGFFDLSHFTRHFKRHVGVTPGNYMIEKVT
ncbi:AraC family transcriptional regulator [Kribbella sp. NPDC055071]